MKFLVTKNKEGVYWCQCDGCRWKEETMREHQAYMVCTAHAWKEHNVAAQLVEVEVRYLV